MPVVFAKMFEKQEQLEHLRVDIWNIGTTFMHHGYTDKPVLWQLTYS